MCDARAQNIVLRVESRERCIGKRIAMRAICLLLLALSAAVADETEPIDKAVNQLEKLGANSVQKRAVVGGVAGLIGGMVVKKAQDAIVTCTLLGGIACGGAVYAGWVKPEQLDKVVDEAKQRAGAFGRMFSAAADAVPSKVKESKVSTMYKKAPGLVLGGAAGFMLGYKLG